MKLQETIDTDSIPLILINQPTVHRIWQKKREMSTGFGQFLDTGLYRAPDKPMCRELMPWNDGILECWPALARNMCKLLLLMQYLRFIR